MKIGETVREKDLLTSWGGREINGETSDWPHKLKAVICPKKNLSLLQKN